MESHEIEGEALWILRRAGLDELAVPTPLALARGVLGPDATVRAVPGRVVRQDAVLAMIAGRPVVCVRRGIPAERARFALAHELAERRLEELGCHHEEDAEQTANALAAALLVPGPALRAAIRQRGREAYEQLAFDFRATQTCTALRVGEVTGAPLAVVAPATVRVRGESWAWGEEREIRREARHPRPGLHKATLTDDRRRVVLAVGDDEG